MKKLLLLIPLLVSCNATMQKKTHHVTPLPVVKSAPVRDYAIISNNLTTIRKCVRWSKKNRTQPHRFFTKQECKKDVRYHNKIIRLNLKMVYMTIETGTEYKEYKIRSLRVFKSYSLCTVAKIMARAHSKRHFLGRIRPTCYLNNTASWILIDTQRSNSILYVQMAETAKILHAIHAKDGAHQVLDF